VATMYEQANYNGRLKDQAAVQNDVVVDRGKALDSDDDNESHGGVELEMRWRVLSCASLHWQRKLTVPPYICLDAHGLGAYALQLAEPRETRWPSIPFG
jgi:hypothetical protein